MSDKERKIMENMSKTISVMTEAEKDNLLAFSEGMAFMVNQQSDSQARKEI